MQEPTCKFETCAKTNMAARGWCDTHYYRWRRYGDPGILGPRGERGTIIADPVERFWSKVTKTPTCWLWGGRQNPKGYGSLTVGARSSKLAHRFSYEPVA